MDPIFTAGIAHIFGVLGWLGAVVWISFKLVSGPGRDNPGRSRKTKDSQYLLPLLMMSGLWVSLSGLFYQYQQMALESNYVFEFWWIHSMILVWILYAVVLFLLEPIVHKELR